jgi:hypothetical protein
MQSQARLSATGVHMTKLTVTVTRLLAATLALGALATPALAQEPPPPPPPQEPGSGPDDPNGPPPGEEAGGPEEMNPPPPDQAAPIPQYAEGAPVPYQNGTGYCFAGPHPIDSREGRGDWDGSEGRHMHAYPPIDLRLFAFRDGCYYFTGDPTDFGYAGTVFPYYGAHPVQDIYGGGWCFMIGGHSHAWRPWSPYFVVTGSWYYWRGAYDPYFWSYWPYYSHYYRSYYPHYYSGGRYFRGHGYHAAPPIRYVPRSSGWRGSPAGGSYRAGSPQWDRRGVAPAQVWRGGGRAPVAAPAPNVWRGTPTGGGTFAPRAPSAPSYRPSAPAYGGRGQGAPPAAAHPGPGPRGGGHRR